MEENPMNIPNTPDALPEAGRELTTLIRHYTSQGEPGIKLLASLISALKRERDRAEAVAAGYLREIRRLNVEGGKSAPRTALPAKRPEPGVEPSDKELAQGLSRERSAHTSRRVLTADSLDI